MDARHLAGIRDPCQVQATVAGQEQAHEPLRDVEEMRRQERGEPRRIAEELLEGTPRSGVLVAVVGGAGVGRALTFATGNTGFLVMGLLILAEGDYVIAHGRFSGHGRPAAWIAADVVRFEDGKLAEHWDVLQDEASREESKSGLPMFGDRFPTASAAAAQLELTVEAAERIVGPLYDALNQPQKKDVAALLAQACHADYKSYSTNEEWLTREQLVDVFKQLGASVPDLSWSIKDIWTSADRIVVRGEATGTPVAEFFGARPTGRSFKTMALDVFTVKGEKLASAYHVENWVGAMQQIR